MSSRRAMPHIGPIGPIRLIGPIEPSAKRGPYNGPFMERLNKLLAHAGVGSRRHCDDLIAAGRVVVDGQKVRELGLRVDPEKQKIYVDDVPVKLERHVYWLV